MASLRIPNLQNIPNRRLAATTTFTDFSYTSTLALGMFIIFEMNIYIVECAF